MADTSKELKIFGDYVKRMNLKFSSQRGLILKVFLKSGKHLSADELYRRIKEEASGIGVATVYRTLKLFCDSGLARELKSEDGVSRFEPLSGHEHHDHLICVRCGKFVEVVHPEIEKLQEAISKKEGFVLTRHRLELYGLCRPCQKRK